MNSRLIRTLIVVIGIAIGLTASYFLKNIDTRHQQPALFDRRSARAGFRSLRDHRRCARRPVRVCRARAGRGVLDVARREPHARASEAGGRAWRSAGVAGCPKRVRAGDGRTREFPDARHPRSGNSCRSGNSLLAADMIFSDGLESTTTASTQVTAALNEELQHRSAGIAALRKPPARRAWRRRRRDSAADGRSRRHGLAKPYTSIG